MATKITQSDLENAADKIVAALERGESFVLLLDGVAVGELTPIRKRTFVPREEALALFAGAPRIDYQQFRADLYGVEEDAALE